MHAILRICFILAACMCPDLSPAHTTPGHPVPHLLFVTYHQSGVQPADLQEELAPGNYAEETLENGRWVQTTWAKISFGILLIAGAGALLGFHLRCQNSRKEKLRRAIALETLRFRKANELLEKQKEEIQAKSRQLEEQNRQISELSVLKTKYFANISHEFRTLITLIKSPIEKLIHESRVPKKNLKDLEMIRRNAGRLIELVNQLLDLSRLDRGKMGIQLIEANIFDFAHTIAISFTSLAEVKGICYRYDIPSTAEKDWVDHDKVEKILSNLLSNAFKFTEEGGKVHLRAEKRIASNGSPATLEFTVTDTGPGIPHEEQKKIFDRFYQAENSLKKGYGGTGLGLALSYELVQLLQGRLEVESEPGEGSTFFLSLPLGKDHLRTYEYSIVQDDSTVNEEQGLFEENLFIPYASMQEEKSYSPDKSQHPIVLVVEDHHEIRGMIAEFMGQEYQVLEAVDGSAGWQLAREHLPDLVVSDLVMPRMDGLELCYKLKTDMLTSHIPVIMLTAKSSVESRLKGYETGADDYMTKPFSVDELAVRIKSLIEQRRSLREKFSAHVSLEPSEIVITSLDKRFLEKAIQVVEKHMSDENFNVLTMSRALNMSRSTLFRKLEALTNQSPVEFIRAIRLKRAASLLMQRYGNISEVALQVGFKNPSYFTQQFRKAYAKTPKEYAGSR